MGHEIFEPKPFETPAEGGENNGEEAEVVEGGDIETEEEVNPETPDTPQETELETLDLLKGVPEAPLEPEDEL